MTQRAIDGPYIYFVTTVVSQRRRFFVKPERAEALGKIVYAACRIKSFELLGYCVLPDHIHLLVRKVPRALEKARYAKNTQSSQRRLSSLRENYRLSDLMQSIKGNFSWQLWPGRFWQPRFNFRIIDNEDRLIQTVEYIRYNYQKMELPDICGRPPWVRIDWSKIEDIL